MLNLSQPNPGPRPAWSPCTGFAMYGEVDTLRREVSFTSPTSALSGGLSEVGPIGVKCSNVQYAIEHKASSNA